MEQDQPIPSQEESVFGDAGETRSAGEPTRDRAHAPAATRSRDSGVAALVRRSRWAVLTTAFAGLGLAALASIVLPKRWQSSAELEVKAPQAMADGELAARAREASEQMRTESAMMKVVESLRLGDADADLEELMEWRSEYARDLADGFSADVSDVSEESCHLRVTLCTADPTVAHRALQALLNGYRSDIYERPRVVQQTAVDSAKKAVAETGARAEETARALAAWVDGNSEFLGGVDTQLAEVQRSIQSIERTDLLEARRAQAAADEILRTEEPTRRETVKRADPAKIAAIDARTADLEAAVRELMGTQGKPETDADVLAARSAIQDLVHQKAELEHNAPETVLVNENPVYVESAKQRDVAAAAILIAERQLASFRKNERLLQEKLRRTPEVVATRDRLAAEAAAAKKAADERSAALTASEARLAEIAGKRSLEFRIVATPEPPQSPAGTHPLVLAFGGLVLGAAGGVAMASVARARDRSFQDADAVAALLDLPVLGAIPEIVTQTEAAEERARTRRKAATVAAVGIAALVVVGWAVVEPSRTAGGGAVQQGAAR